MWLHSLWLCLQVVQVSLRADMDPLEHLKVSELEAHAFVIFSFEHLKG